MSTGKIRTLVSNLHQKKKKCWHSTFDATVTAVKPTAQLCPPEVFRLAEKDQTFTSKAT